MRKENPSHSIDSAATIILRLVPREILPIYGASRKHTIIASLQEVTKVAPDLHGLTSAVLKEEGDILMQQHGDALHGLTRLFLRRELSFLPSLPTDLFTEPLFDKQSLFIVGHDVGKSFSNFVEKAHVHELTRIQRHFFLYDKLRYRYEESIYEHHTRLPYAYARLMRRYIDSTILPAIEDATVYDIPIGNYEVHEMRSALRELLGLSPTLWATSVPLRTTLEQFIQDSQFYDKNSYKPVIVSFDEDSPDPQVYIDVGDLYRMMRNLLRDAVTHGEGPHVTPIIRIKQETDCVYLEVLSPGALEDHVLRVISKQPYTTQRGEAPHGYGKVGARRLLESLWQSLGVSTMDIQNLLKNHWSNIMLRGVPYVQWSAPLPFGS